MASRRSSPIIDLLRAEAWFLEQFRGSFEEPPHSLTLDIDLFDDPTHGQQQLTFFHGHYNQYQYQVRLITCAENDQIAFPVLLRLRRLVADPPQPPPVEPEMPVEARSPRQKRRRHNERRQADPLGEGHACTWRRAPGSRC